MKHLAIVFAFIASVWGAGFAWAATGDPALSMPPPTQEELARTAEINAWLDEKRAAQEASRIRHRWVTAGVALGLTVGFIALVRRTWRSGRSLAFKCSRVLLWAPCFLLASVWWFPPSLWVAFAWAPALVWVWWKRALSWWELGVASALYLSALVFTWLVFRTLAAMGAG
ncbi:hypothetical protein [Acidovorax sp. FJL06]|uniref:hypothetical protein n=1 Tax=Acidovorax sp. FJL06 TaxID=2153365 RepID=UPI000F57091B|nr:hypothetical protein [Acidovorax sp. FJL06]RQO81804.1 hypothetical protein DBV10_12370 [Acidovorax sp. FJL06]